jgi:serine/threonine-protein kinase
MQMQNDPEPPRQLNSSIPVGLEQITMRAMRKNPNKRYLSDAEMLRDLEEFKRNPDIVFNYDNFESAPSVDSSPTRYIDTPVVKSGSAADKIDELYGKKSVTDEFDSIAADDEDDYDEEPEKRSSLIPVLLSVAVAVVVLVVGFGAFFLVRYFGGDGNQDTTCPALLGMNYEQAKEQYKDDISIVVKDWEYNDEYALNEIIDQQYDPGKSLKKGSQVNVIVSRGKQMIEMPNLYDMTSDAAKQKLKDSGINNNISIINEYNSSVDKNKVIRTSPDRGQLIDNETVIEIYVSAGKPTRYVTVPNNLIGRKLDDVKKDIEKADLKVGKVVEVDDAAADGTVTPKGIVIRMSANSGDSLGEFTAIDLFVSSGNKPTVYTFEYTVPKPADYSSASYKFVAKLTTEVETNEITHTYTNEDTEFSFKFESIYKDATVKVTLNGHPYLDVYFKDGKAEPYKVNEYSLGGLSEPAGQ